MTEWTSSRSIGIDILSLYYIGLHRHTYRDILNTSEHPCWPEHVSIKKVIPILGSALPYYCELI
jgi:hypothetical protein